MFLRNVVTLLGVVEGPVTKSMCFLQSHDTAEPRGTSAVCHGSGNRGNLETSFLLQPGPGNHGNRFPRGGGRARLPR